MKYFWILFFFFPMRMIAQIDKLPPETPSDFQQIIEDYLAETDQEEFDFNTLLESLEFYLESPLDLNRSDENTLREFVLLNNRQIDELIRYRTNIGPLLSLYELQAIPGFDLAAIRRILPFVTIEGDTYDYNLSIKQMITSGKNELYFRWGRVLEQQKGYRPLDEGENASRYIGDPNQLYTRFRHSYGNRLSYGFTAEKDRGEAFFKENNKKGFDFYTAHFYLRNYNQRIKALALGDYSISLGQGLILYTGFAYGKSTQVTNIRRGGRIVRPYTSVNEAFYMRGGAATIGLSDNIDVTVFGSVRNRDANFIDPVDTFAIDPDLAVIASLGITGLHRTPSEVANKNVSRQFSTGGSIKYEKGNRHIAINAVFNRFGNEVNRTYKPYNQFDFRGQQLLNASLDYGFMLRNISFFGETAMSDNGAIATLNGLLIGLTPKVDFAMLHRYFPRNYQVLEANPFGETRGGRNEAGLYLALEVRPHKNWKISGYFDRWHHPWLRFLANAPSRGHEYRARITWWAKRKFEFYVELRDETKERNFTSPESKTKLVPDHRTFQTRFHFSYNLSKSLSIRSRLDFGFNDNGLEPKSTGVVIYQDVIYKSLEFPLSFSTRFVLMDTDGFAARYYSYENNLLYTFSIPPYYNKGTRYYLNLRYRGIRNLTLEARIERTLWTNQTTIGGGLEEIDGNTRTGVSAQIKYKF
jgi:hypothetical protein